VRSDDPKSLNSSIEDGIVSSILCHLGNISTRVGRRVGYDPSTGKITGDEEANNLLARRYRTGYELPYKI